MRLTGVTSIPSPVTGLRAGNPPAEGMRRRECGSRTVRQPTFSPPRAREATCASTQRAISSVHPMHRNTVAKPTTVTQPTCVNTRQFVRTDRRYRTNVVPCRENYRNYLNKSQHISFFFYVMSFHFTLLLSYNIAIIYNNLFST